MYVHLLTTLVIEVSGVRSPAVGTGFASILFNAGTAEYLATHFMLLRVSG